ncbi:hypothetical protein [Halorientalis halophila]|uniref:hypothetical protein n=1 Tax=Halorientalis halophila TaxID=3108499 RepID=UPI003008396D
MSDDGYVHEPGEIAGDGSAAGDADRGDPDEGASDATPRDQYPRNTVDSTAKEFDWRGWLLVGAIVIAFLVVPGALYLLPAARGGLAALGLGWRHTYLALPLIPALLLAAIAVWSAVRSRAG